MGGFDLKEFRHAKFMGVGFGHNPYFFKTTGIFNSIIAGSLMFSFDTPYTETIDSKKKKVSSKQYTVDSRQ